MITVGMKEKAWMIFITLLLALFQFLALLMVYFCPSIICFPSVSLPLQFNINPSSIFFLQTRAHEPRILTLICGSSHFCPLFSCLPSLREISSNRSLDNLDCIGGSSLPRWDDDDFSHVSSTLGRRSCMGQVSTCKGTTEEQFI